MGGAKDTTPTTSNGPSVIPAMRPKAVVLAALLFAIAQCANATSAATTTT